MSIWQREVPKPATHVQFITKDHAVSFPISIGYDSATVGLGERAVWIGAGETRVILWPDGCDHWTLNGVAQGEPQWWQPMTRRSDAT